MTDSSAEAPSLPTATSSLVMLFPVASEGASTEALGAVTCAAHSLGAESGMALVQQIREYQEKLQRMAFDATVAEERERRRIAVDLHDRIAQTLAAARLKMISARQGANDESRGDIEAAIELIAQTIGDTRTLMFELSPPVLYDLGLWAAVAWLAEEVETRDGFHVEVHDDDSRPPLDETTSAILFRSIRELITNAIKHSHAKRAAIALRTQGARFEIEVSDAGGGFDGEARDRAGFGLFSIREQMSRLGGAFEVKTAPAEGTRVTLAVPIGGALSSPRVFAHGGA